MVELFYLVFQIVTLVSVIVLHSNICECCLAVLKRLTNSLRPRLFFWLFFLNYGRQSNKLMLTFNYSELFSIKVLHPPVSIEQASKCHFHLAANSHIQGPHERHVLCICGPRLLRTEMCSTRPLCGWATFCNWHKFSSRANCIAAQTICLPSIPAGPSNIAI